MDSYGSRQGQVAVSCEDSEKLAGSINCGQILDCRLLSFGRRILEHYVDYLISKFGSNFL